MWLARYYQDYRKKPRYLMEGPMHPLTTNVEDARQFPTKRACHEAIFRVPMMLSVVLTPARVAKPKPKKAKASGSRLRNK